MAQVPRDALPAPDTRIDMFFHYDAEATSIEGKQIQAPPLDGMSGASVWHISTSENSRLWTPESRLRIVGVQSAYRQQEYFRAINWLGVIEIFRKIDEGLASTIEVSLDTDSSPQKSGGGVLD
jgi:hypothetical protein